MITFADEDPKPQFTEIDVEVECNHGTVSMGTVINGILMGASGPAAKLSTVHMNREQAILVRDGLTKCIEATPKS